MNTVLAAVDGHTTARSVLAAAQAMSVVFDGSVRAVHVRKPSPDAGDASHADPGDVPLTVITGDPVDEIVRAADHTDVALVVVGARDRPSGSRPAGHVALGVAERTSKPVLVVPARAMPNGGSHAIKRALVPLEGASASADAVSACMCLLAEAGVELVAVHVFDEDVPRFWDEPAHAADAYTDEFSARWCPQPDVDVRLRRGSAPTAVMDVAEVENVDVIALAWSQDMSPGHARMIRSALTSATMPVLLVPVPAEPDLGAPPPGRTSQR